MIIVRVCLRGNNNPRRGRVISEVVIVRGIEFGFQLASQKVSNSTIEYSSTVEHFGIWSLNISPRISRTFALTSLYWIQSNNYKIRVKWRSLSVMCISCVCVFVLCCTMVFSSLQLCTSFIRPSYKYLFIFNLFFFGYFSISSKTIYIYIYIYILKQSSH